MKRALVFTVLLLSGTVATGAESNTPVFTQKDIFVSGTDGYHTFRIPAIVVSKSGVLLAFCEGRKNNSSDHGDIDIVLKRSADNGETWSEMQIVWNDGTNTIGNPCAVVDGDTGCVWLAFTRNNDGVFVTKSKDDGATWMKPVEITSDVKLPDWSWYATGPGHGIQLTSGRLLVPCDHRIRGLPRPDSLSHVVYSDDHGITWKLGGTLSKKTNECEAVETVAGTVYLNMRSKHGKNRRVYAWSKDGGETWSDVEFDDTLLSPQCQASIVRFTDQSRNGKNRVLFSNPASKARTRMTVRISYDECKTWNEGRVLNEGPSAYSDLCIAPDMTICCLYERGDKGTYERLTFARFNLEWLSNGTDRLEKANR
jgi:sialidase-1